MITCQPDNEAGVLTISGVTPNGNGVVTRQVSGEPDFILRQGAMVIDRDGFILTDSEAPLGVPVSYRADITNISAPDRVIQQNLMLTPTFERGVFGWTAGNNRTLSTVSDTMAHSATVGRLSANAVGATVGSAPTYVGHVDSTFAAAAAYTLTPPTTGGTAIATNDWMLLAHTQVTAVARPAIPTGWTELTDTVYANRRQILWVRKRLGGDTGYTVAAVSGASSIATLVWVRGASDEVVFSGPDSMPTPGLSAVTIAGRRTVMRPSLAVAVFSAVASISTTTAPTSGSVTGATWQFNRTSGTLPQTMVVATSSLATSGETPTVTTTFSDVQTGGLGTQVVFQATGTVNDQVIIKGKAAALPADPLNQYLLTGRVRFTTPALWTWQDVKNFGTWQAVKTAKATWLDVRGSGSVAPAGNYLNLFVTIVDPATGTDYINPRLVLSVNEGSVNKWLDFSVLFDVPASIPTTAEVRLSHGTNAKEFPVIWYLDEFGITAGSYRAVHSTRYWFDGDSIAPANSEDYLLPDGKWNALSTDGAMVWDGIPSNSTSTFYGPSSVTTTTECGLDPPTSIPCEPVLLSDPTDTSRYVWGGLILIDATTHPANQSFYSAIDRPDKIAVGAVRNWQESSLVIQTDTLAERDMALRTLEKGKIVLLRNPNPAYPERNWYLAIGDVTEARVSQDHREPHRSWTIPFVRVDRPTGDIEAHDRPTWADLRALGTWANVRAMRGNWLGAATGRNTPT